MSRVSRERINGPGQGRTIELNGGRKGGYSVSEVSMSGGGSQSSDGLPYNKALRELITQLDTWAMTGDSIKITIEMNGGAR